MYIQCPIYWVLSQYKDGLSRYGDFHYEDNIFGKPSYLYNGNTYIGKTVSETEPWYTG